MPAPEQTKQRLFFALWPDDTVRKSIARVTKQAAKHHQGKIMRSNNLHLTLVFLGNVGEQQRECIEAMASTILMTPFSLCLEHIGVFPRSGVLWLGVKEKPDALLKLAADLGKGVRDCGIELDEKGFNPHITLMRKVKWLHNMEVEAIHWDVKKFCLVQSVTHQEGVEYRVVKSW